MHAAGVEGIVATLQHSRNVTCLHLICASLFLWEHALTLRHEYELIWQAKWSIGKALFLLERYLIYPQLFAIIHADLTFPSARECRVIFIVFSDYWTTLTVAIASTILILRTWAIWGSQRYVLVMLLGFLFGILVPIAYFTVLYGSGLKYVPSATYSASLRGCFLSSSGRTEWVTFLISSCFDLLILTMTAMKASQIGLRGTGILIILFRDGIVYYTCIFVLSALNFALIVAAPIEYIELLRLLHTVLHSILSCRVILHLREASSVADADDFLTSTWEWKWGEREG